MSFINVAEGDPATKMIKLLLRHINKEAVHFKRFKASSKQILTKANDIYNAIQQHIEDIKKKTEKAEEPDQTKYKAYTEAIPRLERLLLDYTYDIRDMSSEFVNHSVKNFRTSVASIERWANNWQVTVKIVEQLKSKEFQELSEELKKNLETGLAESVKQDDIDMIKEVQSYAKGSEHKLKDDSIFEAAPEDKMVTGLTELIDKIAIQMDTKYDQASAQPVVKTVLLVYLPFALTTDNEVDSKWAEHLKSKKVWKEMNHALKEVVGHLTDKAKSNEQLEENCKALEQVIFTFTELPELFGPQLLQMINLAGQVRRPFHGRSVVLVYMWYHMALSKDVKAERSAANRRAISTSIKQSIELLVSASTKLRGATTFNDANEVQELTSKFTSRSAELEKFYSLYKLGEKWTSDINVQLVNATKVDNEHYVQTKARVQGPRPARTAT
ncbi:hypothetical protein K443DRAFT_673621 [Laccaria amethystina LaAM-08-1]|uniref:Uncharacterized protein n=1 Tax=Laccaria amethystina LaAM-08-1 TaxID=1095629 RepID=A0A0C9XPJ8_9AGAR|nr:hypothetical protein K443DRAFT_673621 [Laccaria amethystina LaAM-08-1]